MSHRESRIAQVLILRSSLVHVARLLDLIFDSRPLALLYFVMICCPLLMNLLQVCQRSGPLDVGLTLSGNRLRNVPIIDVVPSSSAKEAYI